ncbi:MAG: hypothetical protein K2H29_11375 [Oscillospiraceae bacterium]|nr:hypothetical protein [Oscillospiraceae bacterium]
MPAIYTVKWSDQNKMQQNISADGIPESSWNRPIWNLLHDARSEDYHILEPDLKMQKTGAGSFTFRIPPTHPDYAEIVRLGIMWDVAVYKNDEFLWSGHPLALETDLYGTCSVTCEGVLGYLSDIYLEPFHFKTYPSEMCKWFVNIYRDKIRSLIHSDDINPICMHRTFQYGSDVFNDQKEYLRYTGKHLTAMEAIQTKLIDYFGGWLEVTESREFVNPGVDWSGIWKIIYHVENPDQLPIQQKLEIGVNIISLTQTLDYTDFATALVPVDSNGNAIYTSGQYEKDVYFYNKHIKKPQNTALFINIDLAEKYGIITKQYTEDAFEDWLENFGYEQAFLDHMGDMAFNLSAPLAMIEVQAIDLSILDDAEASITIGCKVPVILQKNAEPVILTVNEIQIRLDDPTQNTITLGGTVKTLTNKFL